MGAEVEFCDFRELVVPTTIKNYHLGRFLSSQQDIDTVDSAYIFSSSERNKMMEKIGINLGKGLTACDFAIANGTKCEAVKQMKYWVRPGFVNDFRETLEILKNNQGGITPDIERDDIDAGIAPVMNFDIQKILQFKQRITGFGNINAVKDDSGKVLYHMITVGCWPEKIAKASKEMEWLYNVEPTQFFPTGKTFADIDYQFIVPQNDWDKPYSEYVPSNKNLEYLFQGKYYVRAKNHTEFNRGKGGFKNEASNGYVWIEEKPKEWVILNYKDLPKQLNAKGNGKAKTMTVWSGEIMRSGMPYYSTLTRQAIEKTKDPYYHGKQYSYQDSMIHQYLNGEGQFRTCNFLTEALVVPTGLVKTREFIFTNTGVEKGYSILVPEKLKKLHELNREMVRGVIQLKHPEIDLDKFYHDLNRVIDFVDETQSKSDDNERTM